VLGEENKPKSIRVCLTLAGTLVDREPYLTSREVIGALGMVLFDPSETTCNRLIGKFERGCTDLDDARREQPRNAGPSTPRQFHRLKAQGQSRSAPRRAGAAATNPPCCCSAKPARARNC